MPTIFEYRGYAFRVYTNDHPPAHVHIIGPDGWLVLDLRAHRVVRTSGLSRSRMKELIAVATGERSRLLAAWRRLHEG